MSGIGRLDRGLSGISTWHVGDETHLPTKSRLSPAFNKVERPLADILKPPSLDERLPGLLIPEWLTPDLLEPAVMSATREEVARHMRAMGAGSTDGRDGADPVLGEAAAVLEQDIQLDDEVRTALAALLRG
ncbi:MAG: hypothetical protein AAFS07_07165 [Pseudomonadota bacterium]